MTTTRLFHLMDDDEDGQVQFKDAVRILGNGDVDGIGDEAKVETLWTVFNGGSAGSFGGGFGGGGGATTTRVNFRTGRRVAWDDQEDSPRSAGVTQRSVSLQEMLACWMRPFGTRGATDESGSVVDDEERMLTDIRSWM